MTKFFVSILTLIVIVACHTVSDASNAVSMGDNGNENVKASNGSISAMQDSEDFADYMREHANYGKLFREIMEDIEDSFDIFHDYLSDNSYGDISFADSRNIFSFDSTNDDSYDYY